MDDNENYVRIGTRLDTSKLDKDIQDIEKKLDKFRKKEQKQNAEVDGVKVTGVSSLTEEEIEEYNRLVDRLNRLKKEKFELIEANNQLANSQQNLIKADETPNLLNLVTEIERLKQEYRATKEEMQQQGVDLNNEEAKTKLDEIQSKLEETKSKVKELFGLDIDINVLDKADDKVQDIDVNVSKIKLNLETLKDSVSNISSKMGGVVKKVLKWGLAVFSIRSAYMFVRQAVSTLSQYNKQLAADLQYIRYSLANAMAPVVEKLVNLAYTLLIYLNKITTSLFGLNIFANSSAKAFASANKSAKELAKTIAPFDEMNIMQNTSGSSSGAVTPSVYLSVVDLQFEDLLKKIEKYLSEFDWKGLGKKIGDAFVSVDWAGIGSTILSILWEALFGIVKLFTGVDWGPVAESVSKAVISWINTITKKFAETDWQELGKDIMKGIVDWLTNYDYFGLTKSIIKLFLEAWNNAIPELAAGLWNGLIDYILTKLNIKHDSEKIGNSLSEGIKTGMEVGIKSTPFFNTIYSIIKLVKKIFGINSPSKEMQSIGADLMEGLKLGIKNKINSVIDIINTLIAKINKGLSFKWNDITIAGVKLVKAGGVNFGKIPSIPRLATGGIINRPTYAQIGENGREAVLPLDRNTQWIDELAKKINSNGGITNIYLDGRLIQRTISQREEELNFATNGGM